MLAKRIFSLKHCFTTTPILKTNHHFTELELKALLQQPNQLRDSMIEQINQFGQIKIPDYWKQALTDQKLGYYRHQNVFSAAGDFTTSPEISPLFGQMIATWLAVFMQTPSVSVLNPMTNAVEKKFRLVQLGGGRGMLMQDILRSFHSYKIQNYFDLCFIEISEYNRKQQQKNVMDQFKKSKTFFKFDYENATPFKQQFLSQNDFKDIKLSWFSKLQDLLKQDYQNKKKGKEPPITIFVMNQFFDALPITILQYTELGWRQKVLRLSKNPQFAFQLKNSVNTPHQKLLPNIANPQIGDRFQISPESYVTMDMMAKMIKITGGAILNIDYGGKGPFVDSIRAIKSHKYIPAPHYWSLPGVCDLSAHVAFSALAQYAQKIEGIKAFQLVPQQFFLQSLGIETRVQVLSKTLTKAKLQRLQSEVKRLTSPQEMGQYYKVQIISLKQYGEIYPHITVQDSVY